MFQNVVIFSIAAIAIGNSIESKDVSGCPSEKFDLVGDICVLVHSDDQMTWNQSKTFCESHQSHLVQLNDIDFRKSLTDFMIEQSQTQRFWIGGYFNGVQWRWIDEEALSYDIDVDSLPVAVE